MVRTMFVACAVVLVWASAASAQDLAQKGQQVFADQKCAMCHSVAGKGNTKGVLDGVAGKWKTDELRQWITAAKDMSAKHNATRKPPMKDFSSLSKGDVDALVAYLQTLK